MDILLTQTALYLYLLALLLMLTRAFQPRLTPWVPSGALLLGALLQLAAIILRWRLLGWTPVTSLYEVIAYFCCGLALVIFFTFRKFDFPWVASLALALLAGTLSYALYGQDTNVKMVVPALRSHWMAIHVSSWCFSYSSFSLGFVASAALLALRRLNLHPALQERLSAIFYRLVLFGFPFHTLGLITGAVWAKNAWASPWFHDAKEWAAAITWLIYAVYLHLHHRENKGADWLGILGMASIVFAFVGVNYIPSAQQSAHTYVQPGEPDLMPLFWMMSPFVMLALVLWGLGFWKNGLKTATSTRR